MAPVVQFETREDADVEVNDHQDANIQGGKTHAHTKLGMDAQGNVGLGLHIPDDVELDVDAGEITVGGKMMKNSTGNSSENVNVHVNSNIGIGSSGY